MPELTPQQKAQLDKNIKAMLSQGASEQDVISYATDFRARFDVKKKVSIADVGMAARGGGEVGVSKAPSGETTPIVSKPGVNVEAYNTGMRQKLGVPKVNLGSDLPQIKKAREEKEYLKLRDIEEKDIIPFETAVFTGTVQPTQIKELANKPYGKKVINDVLRDHAPEAGGLSFDDDVFRNEQNAEQVAQVLQQKFRQQGLEIQNQNLFNLDKEVSENLNGLKRIDIAVSAGTGGGAANVSEYNLPQLNTSSPSDLGEALEFLSKSEGSSFEVNGRKLSQKEITDLSEKINEKLYYIKAGEPIHPEILSEEVSTKLANAVSKVDVEWKGDINYSPNQKQELVQKDIQYAEEGLNFLKDANKVAYNNIMNGILKKEKIADVDYEQLIGIGKRLENEKKFRGGEFLKDDNRDFRTYQTLKADEAKILSEKIKEMGFKNKAKIADKVIIKAALESGIDPNSKRVLDIRRDEALGGYGIVKGGGLTALARGVSQPFKSIQTTLNSIFDDPTFTYLNSRRYDYGDQIVPDAAGNYSDVLPSERGYKNVGNVFNKILEGAGQLATQVFTSRLGGQIISAPYRAAALSVPRAALTTTQATNIAAYGGGFLSTALQTYGQSYIDFLNKTGNPNKASLMALIDTLGQSAIEVIVLPDVKLAESMKDALGSAKRNLATDIMKVVEKGGGKEAAEPFIKKFVQEAGKVYGKEILGEEVSQNMYNYLVESIFSPETAEKRNLTDETKEVIKEASLSMVVPIVLGGLGGAKRNRKLTQDALHISAQNFETFTEAIENGRVKGIINPQDADAALNIIKIHQQSIENAPKEDSNGGLINAARQLEYAYQNTVEQVAKEKLSKITDEVQAEPVKKQIEEAQAVKRKIFNGAEMSGIPKDEKEEQPTIDQDRVLGDEDVELTPEQKILQQAIDNKEISGVYLDMAKVAVNDPQQAKQLLDDAKSQAQGQVAGEFGNAREGVEKAFGKSIVDFVLPKAEAGSVGVRGDGFKQAGEKARDTKDATHIGRWMLDNSQKGDVVRFQDGGYEVTEVNTKKDGTKELVLTPFEFNEDGSKDYNNSGVKIITEQSIKNGSNLFENAYTNSKGERVVEQSTYEPVEQSLKETPKAEAGSVGVGGAKIKLDPDLANIDPIIIAARNGDKKAQEKLEEYGLDWEQTTTYRFVGQPEVDVLLSDKKVESKRFSDAGIDVTTSPKVTSAANAEYRVTFKESFDVNNGLGKVKVKSKEEGDHNLEKGRGYTLNDVAKIERLDENGNVVEVIYDSESLLSKEQQPSVNKGSQQRGNPALSSVESTAKALEGIDTKGKVPLSLEYAETDKKAIAEAYHADRAAGKETELTKAVEELLGKPTEKPKTETTPTVSSEVVSGSALKDVDRISNKEIKTNEGEINTGVLEEAKDIPNVNKVIAKDKNGNDIKVVINGDKLKGTILSRNGTYLFKAMQGRVFTLAKVGNFYLPFYISSAGTSGKIQGQWYPFFGYNNWLVKGHVGKSGEMEYSKNITEVQNLLNENFIIPAQYLQADNVVAVGEQFVPERDANGKIIREGKYNFEKMIPNKDRKVLYDLTKDIDIITHHHQEQKGETKLNEHDWVAEKTGLNPKKVINDGKGSADNWIKKLVELTETKSKAPTQYTEAATPAKKESGGVSGSALKDAEVNVSKIADEYLYHGTGEGAFRRIREEGLVPQGDKYLYFADIEQYAKTYAQRKGNSFGDRVLRVKKSDAYLPDENTTGGDFKIKNKINPNDIEIKHNGKWIPIQEFADENIGIMPISKAVEQSLKETTKAEAGSVGVGGDVKSYEGMFNPKKTGVIGLDELLKEDGGYNYFYKGVSGEVVMMSPDAYLKKVRDDITRSDRDLGLSDEKKVSIIEGINKGDKINMPYLSLKENGQAHKQEGRNRAVIAKERGEKLIPVFIEKDISFDDKISKGQEYINSAIKNGATTKEEVLSKLKEQGLHRDAIRFIDENFDNKAVEQSLKETPKAEAPTPKPKEQTPVSETPKTQAKELADKVVGKYEKKAREIADKIQKSELPDWLKADLPEGTQQAGASYDQLKKALANAVIEMGKLLDKGVEYSQAIKQAVKELVALQGEQNRDSIEKGFEKYYTDQSQQEPPKPPKEEPSPLEGDEGSRKKAVLNRLYNAKNTPEEAKKAFEREKLDYKPSSQKAAADLAKSIVDEFGVDEAVRLADSSSMFEGDVRTLIFAEVLNRLQGESNAKKWAEVAITMDKFERSAGRATAAVNYFYKNNPYGVVLKEQADRKEAFDKWATPKREQEWKEYFELIQKEPEFEKLFQERVSEELKKERAESRKNRIVKVRGIFKKAKDSLKSNNTYATIIPPHILETVLETMELAYEGGEAVATLIQDAIDTISKKLGHSNWDSDKFRKEWEEKLKEPSKIPLTEAEQKKKILDKFRNKLSGLTNKQKDEVVRKMFEKVVDAGALEYDDLRDIIADTLGYGELTKDESKRLQELVQKRNATDEAALKAREAGEDLRAVKNLPETDFVNKKEEVKKKEKEAEQALENYYKTEIEAGKAARELQELLWNKPDVVKRITSIMQLSTLGIPALVNNPIYNFFNQIGVRFPVGLVNSTIDKIASLVAKAMGKPYQREYNIFETQGEFWSKLMLGTKESAQQLFTGLNRQDYIQKEYYGQQIRPMRALKDLINYKQGKKKLNQKQIWDKALQASVGVPAEVVARVLNLGDKPMRFSAEGSQAAAFAKTLGLKGIDYKLFIEFPREEAYRAYKQKGLTEEEAATRADYVKEAIIQEGKRATFQQDNILNDIITAAASIFGGKDSGFANLTKSLVISPYIKIPTNAFWSYYNLINPEVAILQSFIHAGRAKSWSSKGNEVNAKLQMREARYWMAHAITGMATRAVVIMLVQSGVYVSGSGDDESKKERDAKSFFEQPGSINISKLKALINGEDPSKVKDGLLISNRWIGQFGTVGNAIVSKYEDATPEQREAQDDFWRIVLGGMELDALKEMENGIFANSSSLLQSISNQDFSRYGTNTLNMFANILQPATFAQMNRAALDEVPQAKGDTFLQKLNQNFAQRSTIYRNMFNVRLQYKRNMWGETMPKGGNFLSRMFGISRVDDKKDGRPMYDDFLNSTDSGFLPPVVLPVLNGEKLNTEQHDRLQMYVGNERKSIVLDFINDKLEVPILGLKYSQMRNNETKKAALQYLYQVGRENGLKLFYKDFSELEPKEKSFEEQDEDELLQKGLELIKKENSQ